MKAVIFSDLHVHSYKQFNADGMRLDNCLRVLDDIGAFCLEHGIATVLFCGDLYDTQKALLTEVVNATVAAFIQFAERYPNVRIYAITGNHDQSKKNLLDAPAVSALKHIAAIVPNSFELIDNRTVELARNIYLSGIPYYEYPEHFKDRLEDTSIWGSKAEDVKAYLMIHQTPAGMGNDMIPTDTNPTDAIYRQWDYTFCGHIHARQQITPRFIVVGSPIHRDLADAGQRKGFLVMNLAKPEKGLIFRPLKGYPEFVEKFEDEELPDGVEAGTCYVIDKPRMDGTEAGSAAKVEHFNSGLSSAVLMRNFWEETEGKDEQLLSMGLSFVS